MWNGRGVVSFAVALTMSQPQPNVGGCREILDKFWWLNAIPAVGSGGKRKTTTTATECVPEQTKCPVFFSWKKDLTKPGCPIGDPNRIFCATEGKLWSLTVWHYPSPILAAAVNFAHPRGDACPASFRDALGCWPETQIIKKNEKRLLR